MRFCIESKYFLSDNGQCREVHTANTTEELLRRLSEAMQRPDWSDSVLINTGALPRPAAEAWRRRAAESKGAKASD